MLNNLTHTTLLGFFPATGRRAIDKNGTENANDYFLMWWANLFGFRPEAVHPRKQQVIHMRVTLTFLVFPGRRRRKARRVVAWCIDCRLSIDCVLNNSRRPKSGWWRISPPHPHTHLSLHKTWNFRWRFSDILWVIHTHTNGLDRSLIKQKRKGGISLSENLF
jgi:hypothetical protein